MNALQDQRWQAAKSWIFRAIVFVLIPAGLLAGLVLLLQWALA